MSVIPTSPLIATDVDLTTIIRSQPKLNRVVFRDSYEACVVNHKVVDRAGAEWFAVEVSVDVVF